MNTWYPRCILLLSALLILVAGCMEAPVKDPTVSVSDIAFSDISLKTLKVNTTVIINNPNPFGAKLNKVAFDVYYLDDTMAYLGHGEQTNISVMQKGNTTVIIPVTIENIPALNALGSLVKKGSITLNVNGSAFIDVKVTSFEKRFGQNKTFMARDLGIPANVLSGTAGDALQQLAGLPGAVS